MVVILWVSRTLRVNVKTNHLSVFALGTNFEYGFIWQSIEWPLHLKIIYITEQCLQKKSTLFELSSDLHKKIPISSPLEKKFPTGFESARNSQNHGASFLGASNGSRCLMAFFSMASYGASLVVVVAGGFIWFLICGGHRLFSSHLYTHVIVRPLIKEVVLCMYGTRFAFHLPFCFDPSWPRAFFYMQVEPQQIIWDMKSRWKNHPVFLNSYHMKFKSSHVKGNQWKVPCVFGMSLQVYEFLDVVGVYRFHPKSPFQQSFLAVPLETHTNN